MQNAKLSGFYFYIKKTYREIFKSYQCIFKTKQKHNFYSFRDIINVFIVYELDTWSRDLNSDFSLNDCLFGDVKLAKIANLIQTSDPDKHVYTDYSIGFQSHSEFPLPDGSAGKNVIIVGDDVSSSVDINIKKKIF